MLKDEELEIKPEGSSEEEQSSDPSLEGQSQDEQLSANPENLEGSESAEESEIPEKFRGKSKKDIADSYSNLEKTLGKLSGEIDHYRREMENLRSTVREREQVQPEDQFMNEFEKKVEADPKEALKWAFKEVRRKVDEVPQQFEVRSRQRQGYEYYQDKLSSDTEFKEMHDDMLEIGRTFGHMLKPEFANSKEAIDLMYRLAKEKNLPKFVEKALKSKKTTKQEKRRAYVEGSGQSSPGSEKSFESLSLSEMEARLGFSDDD